MRTSRLLALLAPVALVACFESKSDDDDDDGSSDTDGGGWDVGADDSGFTGSTDDGTGTDGTDTDTDTDTDGTETTHGDPWFPTFMLVEARMGFARGGLTEYSVDGEPVPNYFGLRLVDDEWSGADDTGNYCLVYWEQARLTDTTGCPDCYDGFQWEVDTSGGALTSGWCDDLDPTTWGDDIGETLADYHWEHGFRPLDGAGNEDDVRDAYYDYWDEYGDKFMAHSVAISGEWYDINTAFAYEVEGDEVIVDSDGGASLIPVEGLEDAPPTAYYTTSWFYGFSL
ncbi:MAG: hypothetical protein H6742_19180 [Alphaproteobacteria bacterium]|nr:hypothetical protein [Alphaproteobacteria bacterium]